MIPGSTPIHTFKLPISTNDIAALRIVYEQNGKILIKKEKKDCTMNGDEIVIKLSQKETLQFESNVGYRVQIKARTNDGDVLISKILRRTPEIVIDKEEI